MKNYNQKVSSFPAGQTDWRKFIGDKKKMIITRKEIILNKKINN